MKIKMNDANRKYLESYSGNIKKIMTGKKAAKLSPPKMKDIWKPIKKFAK